MKKLITFLLVMLLLCTMTFADVPAELEPSIEMSKPSAWSIFLDYIIPGTSYTTAWGPGQRIYASEGDFYDLSFRTRCQNVAVDHRFTVSYKTVEGTSLLPYEKIFEKEYYCEPGEWFDVTLRNIQMPNLDNKYCGNIMHVMIKHEFYSNSGLVIDTDSASINGFEKIASVQYECEQDACAGLTGEWSGSKFCDRNDVRRNQYSEFVRNGECLAVPQTLENCGSNGCDDGSCNQKITGYIFEENACFNSYYLSNEAKPRDFYNSRSDCEANIVTEDDVTVYLISEGECIQETYKESKVPNGAYEDYLSCQSALPVEDPEDGDDGDEGSDADDNQDSSNNNDGVEAGDSKETEDSSDELNWLQKFWKWLVELFGGTYP